MATWLQQFRNVLCVCIILNSNHFPSCVLTFAEPLWTDRGLKSVTGVHQLASTSKKKGTGGKSIIKPSPKVLTGKEKAIIMGASGLLGIKMSFSLFLY